MPQIRRQNLPPALFAHLLKRLDDREVTSAQLREFADWLNTAPEVPSGRWFKTLLGLTVCGEGELVKTFLRPGQAPVGEEVR